MWQVKWSETWTKWSLDILLCSFCFVSYLFSVLLPFLSILQSLCWRWLFWPRSAAPCSMDTIWQSSTLLHRFVSLPQYHDNHHCWEYSQNEWKGPTTPHTGVIVDDFQMLMAIRLSSIVMWSHVGLCFKSRSCCVPHHVIDFFFYPSCVLFLRCHGAVTKPWTTPA